MKTNLYIVRHGQSEGNLLDLFLGHTDMDLTELGHEQAEIAANFLDSIPVDAVYSSDLKRAYHTAEHTARHKGLPVYAREGLREIYAGIWEGAKFLDLVHQWPQEFGVWMTDFGNSACPQGESVLQLQKRILDAVEQIAKENAGKTVCIFSHAVAIRALTAAWKNLTPDEMQDHSWPTNASVTHATYEDGKFTLVEYSRDDFMGDKITALPTKV